ncbi:MAG: antibiotic biosynthesis monooxygenase [Actinomycetota bacterium]
MFVVLTTVSVEAGSIPELATLFDTTNRALVADHEDWLGAWFTANEADNTVTVIARWRSRDAYEQLRASDAFQQAMAQFAPRFTGPPSISINEVLVEM